jgi:uncharacterized protein (TIGR02996 family)
MKLVHGRSADDVAFWNAMITKPTDDLPRLVYADYLDERGDPAGGILRGDVPLNLHYLVAVGETWKHQNQRLADWRLAVCEFQAIATQSGFRFIEKPLYSQLALSYFARRQTNPPVDDDGEWRCLSVSIGSGKPVPPFINYLLVHLAIARCNPRTPTARPRTISEGKKQESP